MKSVPNVPKLLRSVITSLRSKRIRLVMMGWPLQSEGLEPLSQAAVGPEDSKLSGINVVYSHLLSS